MPQSSHKGHAHRVRADEEPIVHYRLADLLPANTLLALNKELGTLVLLSATQEGAVRLLAEEQFTETEQRILVALLESFPHHCPYEVLLANFNSGNMRDDTVERWRERVAECLEEGTLDGEMRPVRNMLSRARLKLWSMGLDVVSLFQLGYILLPRRRSRREKKASQDVDSQSRS